MPTQKAIAEQLGMTQQAVSKQMAQIGLNWRTASMDEIRVAYIRRLRTVAGMAHLRDEEFDLTRERAQTERVDRELKSFALAEKRGQLINIEQLKPAVEEMVSAFRDLLTVLGDKLKTEIDTVYDTNVDLQLMRDLIYAPLSQLARFDIGQINESGDSG